MEFNQLIKKLSVIRDTSADLNVILHTDNNVCEDNYKNDTVTDSYNSNNYNTYQKQRNDVNIPEIV